MRSSWNLHDAFDAEIYSSQITFWTAMIREVIPRHRGDERILEFDSWDDGFLRLLFQLRPFKEAFALSNDREYRLKASSARHAREPIQYIEPAEVPPYEFDVVFSTEIFSFLPNLREHARSVRAHLRDGGEYYSAFGSHIENPLWPHRRRLLREDGNIVHDYSLEDVADAFHEEGFEVGLKRLPVDYFNIYDPNFTRKRALSLKLLVDTTYEHKMLFYFRRDDKAREERMKRT